MKTSTRKKWLLLALVLMGLLLGSWFFLRKERNWLEDYVETDDRSLLIARNEFQNSKQVVNGTAFDKAEVELGGIKNVIVPHTAIVKQMDGTAKMQIYMAKTLDYVGPLSLPTDHLTVHDARMNMGCATQTDYDTLTLGTYGEWDSHIEGGAWIHLVIILPPNVTVEKKKGLRGPDSSLHKKNGQYAETPQALVHGQWFGPASPFEGWAFVISVPDMDRTAYQK